MTRTRRIVLAAVVVAALLGLALFAGTKHCPSAGLGWSAERREQHRLKNRNTLPGPGDFDNAVTLNALLQPGDDRNRWSNTRSARIEAYVVSVAAGPLELTNCGVPGRRDTHIHVGVRSGAGPREQVVVETTPRLDDYARTQGWDWSAASLKQFEGRRVRIEGWLFFDAGHAEESENVSPGRSENWRATAWEIHPVTKFEIVE